MKKIVVLLICALLIAALAIPALAAANDTVLTVSSDKVNVKKGDEFVLTFSMTGSDKFVAAGVELYYDANVIELVRDEEGVPVYEVLAPNPWMVIPNDNWTSFAISRFDKREGTLNSAVCSIAFRVISDCPGTAYVTVTKAGASNKASESIVITASGAGVKISGEHSFGAWTETKAPTCSTKGEKVRECAKCGHKETAEIATIPHSYTPAVTAPTCTEKGFTTHTCVCGDSYVDTYVNATGHTYGEWYETKAPTCTAKGEKQHDCVNCDHFENAEVAIIPHSYNAVVTAPTCTEKGFTTHTCVCGDSYVDTYVNATGHTYGEWYETKAPTCTVKGEKQHDCVNCDHFETAEVATVPHTYESAVTAPTCTEKGFTTHTCSVCGDSKVDTYVNPTGHKYEGNWQIAVAPTCTVKGEEHDFCANGCGEFKKQSVPATGHTYDDGVITTAPKCEETGVKTFTCVHGDHSYTETVPATGHTPAADAEVTKEPTCTEKGEMSGKCAVCDKVLEKQEIPALGHSWGEWAVTTPATCTAKGVETRECATCHETETKPIDMIDHDRVSTVTAPTCTEQGYTTVTCKNCDYNTVGEYVKATGHSFGEWVETKASTCIVKGEQRRDCANCDHFETEELPFAAHKYEGTKIEPTCTESGKESGKCSVCGDEVNEKEIPALGHDFGEWVVTKAPTCTEKGEETVACSRCDATDKKEIAALGHTYGSWIEVDEKNHKHVCTVADCGHEETVAHNWDSGKVIKQPCTEEGLKTYTCKDCAATREEVLPADNKHDYTADAKPIVDEEGKVDKTYHTGICACGEEHKEKHSYDIWGAVIKEPTATTKGEQEKICACGEKTIVKIKANGTLDDEPATGDITGQVVMTGVASFSMLAAAAYVFIRKRTT